jgi:hypothetical protein
MQMPAYAGIHFFLKGEFLVCRSSYFFLDKKVGKKSRLYESSAKNDCRALR